MESFSSCSSFLKHQCNINNRRKNTQWTFSFLIVDAGWKIMLLRLRKKMSFLGKISRGSAGSLDMKTPRCHPTCFCSSSCAWLHVITFKRTAGSPWKGVNLPVASLTPYWQLKSGWPTLALVNLTCQNSFSTLYSFKKYGVCNFPSQICNDNYFKWPSRVAQ